MKNFIKTVLAASLMLASVGLQAAEAPMPRAEKRKLAEIETVAVEQTDESKKAKTQELSAFENLPADVKRIILGLLVTASGRTKEAQLQTAAENIRKFMTLNKSFKNFLDDENINGYLIRELAKRYTSGNLERAGIALQTTGAGKWMQYRQIWPGDRLIQAAQDGDAGTVGFILKYFPNYANYISSDREEDTPLIKAVKNREVAVTRRLLQAPFIDVNQKNLETETPLLIAVSSREEYGPVNLALVDLLLKAPGINVNKAYSSGLTALMVASYEGNVEIVKRLLTMPTIPPINVNLQDRETGETALISAVDQQKTDVVKLLLAMPGIDVNLRERQGQTALQIAREKGNKEIIQLLEARGAE